MGSSKRHHSKLSLIVTIGFIFQVLLSPIAMAADCTYEDGSYMAKEKANCEATEGKAWDCASNKCVYDDTTTTMQDSYAQCDGIEDDAKRKECVDSVAMGAGKDAGMTNENYAKEAAKAAELLGWANLIWGALMGGSQSTCTSTTIMKWTGLAQTAGELYAYFFLSDKVSDLHEEYNKKTVAAENYDAQRDAFLFLKEEQETIAKVAKQKNMIYTVAAAGYTAAAGFALYESAMMFAGKLECTFATDSGALACGQVATKQGDGKDGDATSGESDQTNGQPTEKSKGQPAPQTDSSAEPTDAQTTRKTVSTYSEKGSDVKKETTTWVEGDTRHVETKTYTEGPDGEKLISGTSSRTMPADKVYNHGSPDSQQFVDTKTYTQGNEKITETTISVSNHDGSTSVVGTPTIKKQPIEAPTASTVETPSSGGENAKNQASTSNQANSTSSQTNAVDTKSTDVADKGILDQAGDKISETATAIKERGEALVTKTKEGFKDLGEAFDKDKNFFSNMSGKEKDQILSDVKARAGKAASSSLDEMLSWQELANQAKEATRSQNFSQAKSNFSKLPENTQQTTIFNIKSAINNAQKLEVITVNTSPSDANYKTYVKDLIKQWSEISKQATEIGDEESAARANKKIDLWTSKLNSQSSVDRKIMNVFALTEPQFNEMSARVAYSSVEGATTDLNAYIAFKEWHSFNRGNKSSFDLVTYRVVKDYAPDFISFGHIGFKGSLLYMIRFNLMTEAYAGSAGEKIGGLAKGMAIGALKTYALKFAMCTIAPNVSNLISTWLQAPPAVAVMASASAMVNFKLAGVAKKEQQQAEKNAKILEAVLSKFELAQATYCPAGRDDLNNPQCYCYTDNGDKNSNRTNSETCQNLWSKNDTDYFTKAGTYNSSSSGGCAYLNGKYDLDCKCKKLIDSKSGSNACMKSPVTSPTLRGISVPSFGSTASTIGDYLESAGSGAASTGDLDTAAIGNAAQNQKKINDKMAENLNKKLASKGMSPIKLNTEAAMDKLVNSVVPQGNLRSSLLNRAKLQNSSTGNKAMNEKGKKALEEALKQSGIQYEGASSGTGAKKDNYSYLFDNSSAARGPKTKVDNSYMKKKYNYNNEINNDKDASIFDIISKRYTLSGMKKLFGD